MKGHGLAKDAQTAPRNGWMIVFRQCSRFVDGRRYLSFLPNNEYAIYMHWLAGAGKEAEKDRPKPEYRAVDVTKRMNAREKCSNTFLV